MSEYIANELPREYPYEGLHTLNNEVLANPDDCNTWFKLAEAFSSIEDGKGLTRNSDPAAISALRNTFDSFLLKFPLFYGYWHRYAKSEFHIAGPEAAELIYERGIAAIPASVDMWNSYCEFKALTTVTDPDLIRELYERGTEAIGESFDSSSFWDRYIQFEEQQERSDKAFAILRRVIHVVNRDFAKYFDRFRRQALDRPVNEVIDEDVMQLFTTEITQEYSRMQYEPTDVEFDRQLRTRVDMFIGELYNSTQTECAKRTSFENEFTRAYYLVGELQTREIQNWHRYLDFEETEGNFKRIVDLYERCLIPCANYDEFWLRYVRFMRGQSNDEHDYDQDIRNIYMRACYYYCPMSRTSIRINWANYEESKGRLDVARAIHEIILEELKDKPAIVTHLAHLVRRHGSVEEATDVFMRYLQPEHGADNIYSKAWITSEWAQMLWKNKGSPEECRQVYSDQHKWYRDSSKFWIDWLRFELAQPTTPSTESEQHKNITKVMDLIQKESLISPSHIQDCAQKYMEYLEKRGGEDAMESCMWWDREVFGPASVQHEHKKKVAEDGKESTTDRRRYAENGHPGVHVNDAKIRMGVNPYAGLLAEQGDTAYGPNGQPVPLKYTTSGLK